MKRKTIISMFLLANILLWGLLSCQSKNEELPIEPKPPVVVVPEPPVTPEPPVVVPEPPAWPGIPPMLPPNSADPSLLPTRRILMPYGCGWNVQFPADDAPHQDYFFINSYEELKERLHCGEANENIPTVDFNTYTMLGFVSDYGYAMTPKLRKESNSVYKWNIDIIGWPKNYPYWESVILTPKLPQDSRMEVSIDYKQGTETYIETYPVKGRTLINFIDKEKLAMVRSATGIIESETEISESYYRINAEENTIEFIADPSLVLGTISSKCYFKAINPDKFEIEYLYIAPTIPPPIIMTFEKENTINN